MPNGLRTALQGQSAKLGVITGVVYGIAARCAAETELFGDAFMVMSLAFLVLVPIALGFLTVSSAAAPSRAYRIFAPWVPALFVVLAAEGGAYVPPAEISVWAPGDMRAAADV